MDSTQCGSSSKAMSEAGTLSRSSGLRSKSLSPLLKRLGHKRHGGKMADRVFSAIYRLQVCD